MQGEARGLHCRQRNLAACGLPCTMRAESAAGPPSPRAIPAFPLCSLPCCLRPTLHDACRVRGAGPPSPSAVSPCTCLSLHVFPSACTPACMMHAGWGSDILSCLCRLLQVQDGTCADCCAECCQVRDTYPACSAQASNRHDTAKRRTRPVHIAAKSSTCAQPAQPILLAGVAPNAPCISCPARAWCPCRWLSRWTRPACPAPSPLVLSPSLRLGCAGECYGVTGSSLGVRR